MTDIFFKVFIGASPPTLCADGRTDDLKAILHVINAASEYIYIAVNEYIPMDLWKNQKPWTVIDDQIREGESIIHNPRFVFINLFQLLAKGKFT